MDLIHNIVDKRKSLGLSCIQLAEKAGISITSLSRVEQGLTKVENFTMGNAKKLADYLNVSLDTIYRWIENVEPTHQPGNKLGAIGLKQIRKQYLEEQEKNG